MIGELVHLLLSILIRFSPRVGIQSIALKPSRTAGDATSFAIWIPVVGWVAVSVKLSAVDDWLGQRVVSAHWLGWDFPGPDKRSASRWFSRKLWNLQVFVSRFRRRAEKDQTSAPSVPVSTSTLDSLDN